MLEYVAIDDAGISEPQQVAETLTTELTQAMTGYDDWDVGILRFCVVFNFLLFGLSLW
jgi:hypothetical protein